MAHLKSRNAPAAGREAATGIEYRGKQTKTGNSSGFRFEGALFKSHPEFNGDVKAQIIAPGRMLVTAESERREKADPVMASFLAFLAQDIAIYPEKVAPMNLARAKRIARLTKGIKVDPDEDLGEETLL
jgi:prlF antitoxin for toxin YhaV_toxin